MQGPTRSAHSARSHSRALGLLLSDGDALPGWAFALAGIAGAGLATWGVVDIALGASCDGAEVTQKACSKDLERRDVGGLVLLSAMPLLAIPLGQLISGALEPAVPGTKVVVTPQLNPIQRTLILDARVQWM